MNGIEGPTTADPLTPVAAEDRSLTSRDAFSLWFSLGVGLLVMQSGAGLTPGLSLPVAAAVILAGSLIGVVMLGAASAIGAETGVSAMAGLRPVLGGGGARLASSLNALQLVGWGAFELIAMGQVADTLSRRSFGVSEIHVWTGLFGVLATALAVMGPVSFVRRFLRRYGLFLLLGGAAWLTWRLLAHHDLMAVLAQPGAGSLTIGSGLDLVIAMPVSWLPLAADYSRFGRPGAAMGRGAAGGFFLANVWFFLLGAAYQRLGYEGGDMLAASLAAAGGGLALILILIDETDNAFADIYSAATSTAMLVKDDIRRLSGLFGIICTLIALLAPMSMFQDFLFLIGSIFAPLFAVLFAHHYAISPGRGPVATSTWSWRGLAAWAAGVAAYQVLTHFSSQLGATLPAMAVAAGTYSALCLIARPAIEPGDDD